MFDTQMYATRSEYIPRAQESSKDVNIIALDIGYSAVKTVCSNSAFCFPSFARPAPKNIIGTPRKDDIFYRDNDIGEWAVGRCAQEFISEDDSEDSERTLFGRTRYFAPSFLVLFRAGLAYSLRSNKYGDGGGGKPIIIQTGLPSAYLAADTPLIIEALSGRHKFEVKIGSSEWKEYDLTIDESNISVLDQPMGSVFSASIAPNLSAVYAPSGKKYVDSRVIVFDAGFGTLDVFDIANRSVKDSETWSELGMKAVLKEASAQILGRYGKSVPIHAMQGVLATGKIAVFDRKSRTSSEEEISDIIETASRKIAHQALARLDQTFDCLQYHDVLLVTGGTGAAWMDIISDRYCGMETLSVRAASENDTLPGIYSNVRGYYLYRLLLEKRKK